MYKMEANMLWETGGENLSSVPAFLAVLIEHPPPLRRV